MLQSAKREFDDGFIKRTVPASPITIDEQKTPRGHASNAYSKTVQQMIDAGDPRKQNPSEKSYFNLKVNES